MPIESEKMWVRKRKKKDSLGVTEYGQTGNMMVAKG